MIDIDNFSNIHSILKGASASIMEIYNSNSFDIRLKKDMSPVTRADLESEKIIIEGLKKFSPGIPVISEESESPVKNSDSIPDKYWLLDPLDGTMEFIARNGEFSISLALIEKGFPVEGYISAPVSSETWFARRGKGSWKSTGDKITGLPLMFNSGPYKLMKSRSHHGEAEELWTRKASSVIDLTTDTHGSATKFGIIAEGRADLYLKKHPVYGWDIAAGAIILEESGGGMVDYTTGQPVRFYPGKESLSGFLAYGRRITRPVNLLF